MIELSIPGRGTIRLDHLVCDVNGTLALDGRLVEGVSRAVSLLRDRLNIHLLTADLVTPTILNAFELLEKPLRLVATLRK